MTVLRRRPAPAQSGRPAPTRFWTSLVAYAALLVFIVAYVAVIVANALGALQ